MKATLRLTLIYEQRNKDIIQLILDTEQTAIEYTTRAHVVQVLVNVLRDESENVSYYSEYFFLRKNSHVRDKILINYVNYLFTIVCTVYVTLQSRLKVGDSYFS